jgi:hypothetical protein
MVIFPVMTGTGTVKLKPLREAKSPAWGREGRLAEGRTTWRQEEDQESASHRGQGQIQEEEEAQQIQAPKSELWLRTRQMPSKLTRRDN